ncbi:MULTISPECIES: LysR family transcriptional regulator [Actinokineospora]|uniref:Transcriptional regulator n=1 Tax=Actinokineospora fastidiosa TaxID=1816 RepID=A0A918GF75_9PSEU|nr:MULTISPECIES: LysR substrate-binding domain-containing protein [Actinokineospora]UVS80011.1 Hca operon transcriptional activator [Actinokineospora sp. UTMC 2448]GGS32473.1 transcriptional regulator [Actinokineospora fastidiosa]
MELQVRHLRVICAIASAGSLNRAATQLGLGQPALSHQLRRIEKLVGGALFRRGQNGVECTALGVLVLRRARAIVAAFDELERDFHRQEPRAGESVRVGWNNSALTAPLLGSLREIMPGKQIHTRSDVSRSRLLAQVANRGVDLALVMICGQRELSAPAKVRALTVVREPSFVALPADHALAHREEISLGELAGENWIVSGCGDGCRVVFRELCMAHGFDPVISHDVDIDATREDLVSAGCGVALVQPTRPQRPGLVIRPLAGTPLYVRHVLAWREDAAPAFRARELGTRLAVDYWRMADRNPHYRNWLDHNDLAMISAAG